MRPVLALVCAIGAATAAGAERQYRTLNDRMPVPRYETVDVWRARAAYLREHVLASAGLLPLPEKGALNPVVVESARHADYVVSKVYFESLPGFFVTGNLYEPIGGGPFPAILSPHGHWTYGRLENTDVASIPGRAIGFARLGFVVFTYDMIGYNDSRQLTHAFGGRRESLWGLSLGGLQLWNSIRSLDFLESLPQVRRDRIGMTGESGGGTQTFLLAAVDDRIAAAAPVNMISLHMQGGCLCENLPGLRLDTNNLEIAATIAPRPLLMIAATGDWTAETLDVEFPEMRRFYAALGAEDHVTAQQFDAPHNYNRASREAAYAWMSRWLKDAPADAPPVEKPFHVDALPDLLVFHNRALPASAVTAEQLTDQWIAAARRQLVSSPPAVREKMLRHALGFSAHVATAAAPSSKPPVLLAVEGGELEPMLRRAGLDVRSVRFSAFDEDAAGKVEYFETYNRTAASQRVADLVSAIEAAPGATLVADGDAALPALLAAAVSPVRAAVLDVDGFDRSSDAAFLDRLYIPGIRRAGDLETAAAMAHGDVLIHDAGDAPPLHGIRTERRKLTAREIADFVVRANRR